MGRLANIPLRILRQYLEHKGLNHIRTTSGHEVWSKTELKRPVIFQTHINPVPEFIIKNMLKDIKATKEDLIAFLNT